MVLVRETMMADWQACRDIRLLALRDVPDAFASTYAEQVRLGEEHWRQRVVGGGLFLAWIPEVSASEPAGMAGGYQAVHGTVELCRRHRPPPKAPADVHRLPDYTIYTARKRLPNT